MHCWVYLEFQFFGMGCLRQKPVLLKSYQKLFPSVSSEPLKVPWCFICQTKSPHVEIKWLKGYCIPSTFTENIPDQSCISNRWTPCSKTDPLSVGGGDEPAGPLAGRPAPRDAALRLPLRRRGVHQGQQILMVQPWTNILRGSPWLQWHDL